jgi:hypothetical protein
MVFIFIGAEAVGKGGNLLQSINRLFEIRVYRHVLDKRAKNGKYNACDLLRRGPLLGFKLTKLNESSTSEALSTLFDESRFYIFQVFCSIINLLRESLKPKEGSENEQVFLTKHLSL